MHVQNHDKRRRALLACAGVLLMSLALLALVVMQPRAHQGAVSPAGAVRHLRHAYPFVYGAIGASDTYGVGADNPATESWPAVLATYLPSGTHFVNLGVPGILLGRAAITELPVALDAHPDLVTVWLAVNDLAAGVPLERYQTGLAALLGALRRATHARVLVANVPDLTLIPSFAGHTGLASTVASWNNAIAAAAHANGATLVDLYGEWRELAQHPEYVGPDGLHPTVEGYRRLGQIFWRAYVSSGATSG